MPICSVSNPTWVISPELTPNATPISFSVASNATMHFKLINNQTVYMYFNLVALSSSAISIQIGIYDANSLQLVSQLTSKDLNINSNIDLLSGTYIVCIRSLSGEYSGTARADYFGYINIPTLEPIAYESGQFVDVVLKTSPKTKECVRELLWEVVDGTLPPGIILEPHTGMLHGTLPYIDTMFDDGTYVNTPSSTMYYKDKLNSELSVESWGRRWQFKLKISVVGIPENFDEQWFCISIFNNWTRTEDKFYKEYDNGLSLGDVIEDRPKRYVVGLCKPDENIIKDNVKDKIESILDGWDNVTLDDNIILLENEGSYVSNELTNIGGYDIIRNEFDDENLIENPIVTDDGVVENSTIVLDGEVTRANATQYNLSDLKTYSQETITIELDSYDQYLGFRLWAIREIEKYGINSIKLGEYVDSKLFNSFLNGDENVKYEYIYYDHISGYSNKEEEYTEEELQYINAIEPIDTADDEVDDILSDIDRHYIYIYYDVTTSPESDYISGLIDKVQSEWPFDIDQLCGENMNITITWE